MSAIQVLCPQTGESQFFRDIKETEAIRIGKDFIRNALAKGHKDPKAKIIVEGVGVWLVLSKKDIATKLTEAQTLTKAEEALLRRIVASYEADGVENTDFYNLMTKEDNTKAIRGLLGSLTRKQVVNRNDCPDCFNPIYPSNTFEATCAKYGIEYGNKTKSYLK